MLARSHILIVYRKSSSQKRYPVQVTDEQDESPDYLTTSLTHCRIVQRVSDNCYESNNVEQGISPPQNNYSAERQEPQTVEDYSADPAFRVGYSATIN